MYAGGKAKLARGRRTVGWPLPALLCYNTGGTGEVGRGTKGGQVMVATETVKTVVLVLFGLCILWIIVIVVKNDMQTIVRALLVTAVVGLALFLLSQPNIARHEKLSYTIIKNELFPVKARNYGYEKREGHIAGSPTTTYIFDEPGPPLSLSMMSGGKYMAIKDIRRVNVVLEYLGLPPVTEGVSELASITGKNIDSDLYRWDNYEKGILLLERGLCRDMASTESFPCIAQITIQSR
jgi:hypothetical protein